MDIIIYKPTKWEIQSGASSGMGVGLDLAHSVDLYPPRQSDVSLPEFCPQI